MSLNMKFRTLQRLAHGVFDHAMTLFAILLYGWATIWFFSINQPLTQLSVFIVLIGLWLTTRVFERLSQKYELLMRVLSWWYGRDLSGLIRNGFGRQAGPFTGQG